MSRFAAPDHKRVARMIGYALTLGASDLDAWAGAVLVLRTRLARDERLLLTAAAYQSLESEDAERFLRGASPRPSRPYPMFDPGDAELWVESASEEELIGYASAAMKAMRLAMRDGLLSKMRRAA
ncbi:MAG: hypothetical protein AAGJ91_07570 [Pseudomonadota bacterium]